MPSFAMKRNEERAGETVSGRARTRPRVRLLDTLAKYSMIKI